MALQYSKRSLTALGLTLVLMKKLKKLTFILFIFSVKGLICCVIQFPWILNPAQAKTLDLSNQASANKEIGKGLFCYGRRMYQSDGTPVLINGEHKEFHGDRCLRAIKYNNFCYGGRMYQSDGKPVLINGEHKEFAGNRCLDAVKGNNNFCRGGKLYQSDGTPVLINGEHKEFAGDGCLRAFPVYRDDSEES